ncbi:MAG: TIGR00282 family metallophosphoesterase [Planctomycetota bacterium]|jgi:metallophosphoesterase (TIGR00282 family)
MQVNMLCIGDVVGRPGRFVLSQVLPNIIDKYDIHCVICNAENIAGGSGITPQLYKKLLHYGVNLITLGDHAYRKQDIIPVLEQSESIVRPANFPPNSPGKSFALYETAAGAKIAAISLMGRLYMRPHTDCPFRTADSVLGQIPDDVNIVVVDMHAEATSEKIAMGWYLDGKVSTVFGTHTHVPTADECVLPQGTAYITDLGMTGPYDSVLGRRKDRVIRMLTTNVPSPFDIAADDLRLCGILVQVDSTTGKAKHIERVRVDQLAPDNYS